MNASLVVGASLASSRCRRSGCHPAARRCRVLSSVEALRPDVALVDIRRPLPIRPRGWRRPRTSSPIYAEVGVLGAVAPREAPNNGTPTAADRATGIRESVKGGPPTGHTALNRRRWLGHRIGECGCGGRTRLGCWVRRPCSSHWWQCRPGPMPRRGWMRSTDVHRRARIRPGRRSPCSKDGRST